MLYGTLKLYYKDIVFKNFKKKEAKINLKMRENKILDILLRKKVFFFYIK